MLKHTYKTHVYAGEHVCLDPGDVAKITLLAVATCPKQSTHIGNELSLNPACGCVCAKAPLNMLLDIMALQQNLAQTDMHSTQHCTQTCTAH
jgi:hypothetical protein